MKQIQKIKIDLSGACNAKCGFCPYHGENKSPLRGTPGVSPVFMKTLPLLASLESVRSLNPKPGLDYSGRGEALMHPDFDKIALASRKMGFRQKLITNGILLGEHAGIVNGCFGKVIVSLHGIGKAHDSIVGAKGAFSKAVSGIRRMIPENVMLAFVATSENFTGMEKFAKLAGELKVKARFQFDFLAHASEKLLDLPGLLGAVAKIRSDYPRISFVPELNESQIRAFFSKGAYIVNPRACCHYEQAVEIRFDGMAHSCSGIEFGSIYTSSLGEIVRRTERAAFMHSIKSQLESENGLSNPACDRCCYQIPQKEV
ncbi:MAG TPA: radical SAM protein [Candidatus Micrarchaeota archaeon]|nr:radical SAM protein [Candidatus Micrarchaeota archaeon]